MPNILDPKFRYTPAAQTDIKKAFARRRRELAEQKKRDAANEHERIIKVRSVHGGR